MRVPIIVPIGSREGRERSAPAPGGRAVRSRLPWVLVTTSGQIIYGSLAVRMQSTRKTILCTNVRNISLYKSVFVNLTIF